MSRFLFASGQMSCTRFEEEEKPKHDELMLHVKMLLPPLHDYIQKQHTSGVGLWENIEQDVGNIQNINYPNFLVNIDNFIKRRDGKFVCIDPVYYKEPQSKK